MNGLKIRTNGDAHTAEQLPTPSSTPEPDDLASPTGQRSSEARDDGRPQDASSLRSPALSGASASRRTSLHEEAVLSDASEKIRPIKRPGDGRRKSSLSEHDKVLKLSPRQIQELTSEPASLPVRTATPIPEDALESSPPRDDDDDDAGDGHRVLGVVLERPVQLQDLRSTSGEKQGGDKQSGEKQGADNQHGDNQRGDNQRRPDKEIVVLKTPATDLRHGRPGLNSRSVTTPVVRRLDSSTRSRAHTTQPHDRDAREERKDERRPERLAPSPLLETAPALPLPPMSMPTFLSLELSASRPSPLYIYRPSNDDFPYESSAIKYERLLNFLQIPYQLEGVLAFGALACLDAWMHVMTILPLRFLLAVGVLTKWWGSVIVKEFRDLSAFIYSGLPRVWQRRRNTDTPTPAATPADEVPPSLSRKPSGHGPQSANAHAAAAATTTTTLAARQNGDMSTTFTFPDLNDVKPKRSRNTRFRHRRTKSTPSLLLPNHKADILKGLLVVSSCFVLMRFDASRMYHGIRGQSAIKLYVIYNLLEVCDRLLSALGQDILECLFSRETLDRNPDGRSKVIRPFWMFLLALVYTVVHATALFYQVVTLNVAVNSYSNALLTLLMSNQFVEIKGTVFKKFEKESLFQITCADVVERFQLWLMLLIIAMRNMVEVGGLSIQSSATSWTAMFSSTTTTTTSTSTSNASATTSSSFAASSIIPMSFTIFPKYIAQVLNPFLLVLGSEMAVDWLKHAYITKFNQTKPAVYGKFFDVLAKDYYAAAFSDPNLTRRLGLPVIPLSCLFIRAAIQTYHMFIATYMPAPLPYAGTSTSLTADAAAAPSTTAALAHMDHVFRRALGRSAFGGGGGGASSSSSSSSSPYSWASLVARWSLDDVIAASTMLLVFLISYCVFLAFKLLLGMFLLTVSRRRVQGMRERELLSVETGGKRVGGWGVVDVDDEKRRWVYEGDEAGLRALRERDDKARRRDDAERERGSSFGGVSRYAMVAKRIW
ncbi:eukaryotic membrane protein family [Stagonosporopsis vannaccii]|nr:eukaryotic membrane protein family [Stagonosporopsis vannaccii]